MRVELSSLHGKTVQFEGIVGEIKKLDNKKLALLRDVNLHRYGEPDRFLQFDHLWVELNLATPKSLENLNNNLDLHNGKPFLGLATVHLYQRRNGTQDFSLKSKPFIFPDWKSLVEEVQSFREKRDRVKGLYLLKEVNSLINNIDREVLLLDPHIPKSETVVALKELIQRVESHLELIHRKSQRRKPRRFLKEARKYARKS